MHRAPPRPNGCVLLVEDNSADARLAVEAFAECWPGGRIVHVPDGDLALARLRAGIAGREELPRLVLLDLSLPGRHGREVLAAIRSDRRLARVPVVVLSTSTAEQDILHCYELAANAYVAKPVELGAFQRAVEAMTRFWLETAEIV